MTRFGNANEHADWETAHHVFTYANAVHQMLTRIGTVNTDGYVTGVRGVLHGAMALYLTRYLNVPPARVPGEDGQRLDDLPADAEMILQAPVLRMSNGQARTTTRCDKLVAQSG